MSDETTPKWDCEIIANGCLVDYDFHTIHNPKDYIGKTMRLGFCADLTANSEYYAETKIENYYDNGWGYADRFLWELIPNTKFFLAEYEFHLGKLIAVLD